MYGSDLKDSKHGKAKEAPRPIRDQPCETRPGGDLAAFDGDLPAWPTAVLLQVNEGHLDDCRSETNLERSIAVDASASRRTHSCCIWTSGWQEVFLGLAMPTRAGRVEERMK